MGRGKRMSFTHVFNQAARYSQAKSERDFQNSQTATDGRILAERRSALRSDFLEPDDLTIICLHVVSCYCYH